MFSEAEKNNEFLVVITPDGIRHSKSQFREAQHQFFKELGVVGYLVKSDISSRIFGKSLGILWLGLDPFLQAFVYYFLTSIVFRGVVDTGFVALFMTVIVWQLFSRIVGNAPSAISSNASVLKQTNFPMRIVILNFIGIELALWFFSFLILLVFLSLNSFYPTWKYVLLPFGFLAQTALALAVAYPLSILGAYVKELGSFVNPIIGILFYLSPGIYPVEKIPLAYRFLFDLNPFTYLFGFYRYVFFGQEFHQWWSLGTIFLVSILILFAEISLFNKAKQYIFSYI